jgi:DNA-binding transcriptional MocR family regulator
MNVWVRLPGPLDAGELLPLAQKQGVAYLPGRYFEVARRQPGALRLSFAGLAPEQIRRGLEILGGVVAHEIENAAEGLDPAPAMV